LLIVEFRLLIENRRGFDATVEAEGLLFNNQQIDNSQ